MIKHQFINDYLEKVFPRILLGEVNLTLEPIRDLAIWPVVDIPNMRLPFLKWLSTNKIRGAPIYYRKSEKISISSLINLLSEATPVQLSFFSSEPFNNTYPLSVPLNFQERVTNDLGRYQTLTCLNIENSHISRTGSPLPDTFQALEELLVLLERSLGRAPPELSSWKLVISTDLSLTEDSVASCNINTKTVYLHPYFFKISPEDLAKESLTLEQLQLKILYHELISHIAKGIRDEDAAMEDTELFMPCFACPDLSSVFAGIYVFKGKIYFSVTAGKGINTEEVNIYDGDVYQAVIGKLEEYAGLHGVKFVSAGIAGLGGEETELLKTELWMKQDILAVGMEPCGSSAEAVSRHLVESAAGMFKKVETLDVPEVGINPDSGEVQIENLTSLDEYRDTVSPEEWEMFGLLAGKFRGKRLMFISSTPQGGGVALMRHALIRLLRLRGVDAHWHVLENDPAIFEITKPKMHNVLQGVSHGELSEEDKRCFTDWSRRNALGRLADGARKADVIVIDDYQPSGTVPFIKKINPGVFIIMRSHIQLQSHLIAMPDSPQRRTWSFIWDNVKDYVNIFVSHPIDAFVPGSVSKEKLVFMPATTDPLDGLNKPIAEGQRRYYREKFGRLLVKHGQLPLDYSRPYIIQVARFDPSKGIPDVLEAYRMLRRRFDDEGFGSRSLPQLVIVGNGALDDPEGGVLYDKTVETLRLPEFKDIAADIKVARLPHNDQLLNVLLRDSMAALQLSIAEGYEVKVSEALAKGKPVIAYRTGGIPLQIKDKVNGYLIEPGCVGEVAGRLYDLLTDGDLYREMSGAASMYVNREPWTVPNAIKWLFLATELIETRGGFKGNGIFVEELIKKEFINWMELDDFNGSIEVNTKTGRIRFKGEGAAVKVPNIDLWVVRHGETEGNAKKFFQGSVDGEDNQLNDNGISQAGAAAKILFGFLEKDIAAGRKPVVITSRLSRAKDTAAAFLKIVREKSGIVFDPIENELANEASFGIWENKTMEELPVLQQELAIRYRKGLDAVLRPENGESFIELLGRAKVLLSELEELYNGRTVVLFSHGILIGALRTLLADKMLLDSEGCIDWRNNGIPNAQPRLLAQRNFSPIVLPESDLSGSALYEQNRNYPLPLPQEARYPANNKYGNNRSLAAIPIKDFESFPRPVFLNSSGYEALKRALAALERSLGRAPPELSSWKLVISTDLSLTEDSVAS
ncbi:MAG: histidine phosphatase family protein, partial [Candidatus Omnitrophica bacterium]|nr:histidine phosphatase family protein [Candidatus Omnitrophota bacterium]